MAWKTYRAFFWDKSQDFHGKQKFKKSEQTFTYSGGSYNVDLKAPYFEDNPIPFVKRRTYIYNVGNSNPLYIDTTLRPPITPQEYEIHLKTKVLKDLNDLVKGDWLSKLFNKTTIVILIVLVVGWFMISKGYINLSGVVPTP